MPVDRPDVKINTNNAKNKNFIAIFKCTNGDEVRNLFDREI